MLNKSFFFLQNSLNFYGLFFGPAETFFTSFFFVKIYNFFNENSSFKIGCKVNVARGAREPKRERGQIEIERERGKGRPLKRERTAEAKHKTSLNEIASISWAQMNSEKIHGY